MAVTESDVRHIAALARVGIADERLPALVQELNGILGHMDALQAVNLVDAPHDVTPIAGMPLREDIVNPVALNRAREAFAPAMRDGFFLVPRLDTHGASGAAESGEDDS